MRYQYKSMKVAVETYGQSYRGPEDYNFGLMMDYFADIGAAIGIKSSVWSMYDECTDMFSPYPDQSITMVGYDSHWGPQDSIDVEVRRHFFDDVTLWADVWLAADVAIERSGDQHHLYIESFHSDGSGRHVLLTGS